MFGSMPLIIVSFANNVVIHEHGILAFRLFNDFGESFFIGFNLLDHTEMNCDGGTEHVTLSST